MRRNKIVMLLWVSIIFMGLVAAKWAIASGTNWTVDAPKAKIEFAVSGPFGKVNGSFSGLETVIVFDENNLTASSISATVEVKTIETGVALRNSDLRDKEEWFNVAKYPIITIQSKQIQKVGQGYKLSADLTMKGITKRVEIPFKFVGNGNTAVFSGQFEISREDYGVGKSGGTVGKTVTIKLDVPVNAKN